MIPPTGNTGGNSLPGALVDWLSVSFPGSAVGAIPVFLKALRRLFDGTVTEFRDRPTGIYSFAFSCRSDVGGVLVAWGGANTGGRVFLDLPGIACARVECWARMREFVELHHGSITRCDLAVDCFEGEHTVDEAVELYLGGKFKAKDGGRQPSSSQAGNWLCPDGKGRTLYVGRGANGKMLRVYEKGKQLGDKSSPWVRWEVQLRNVDRVLPTSMLTDPAAFVRGAYRVLDWVSEDMPRIRVRKAVERVSVETLTGHARRGYGALVDVLVRSGRDAVADLRRDGLPRRLDAPTAAQLVDRCNGLAQLAAAAEFALHMEAL
jgi:phage replication initiation protein